MKVLLRSFVILFALVSVMPLAGCNTGPKKASEEEGKLDMSEFSADPAGVNTGGGGAEATPGTETPAPGPAEGGN